MHFCQLRKAHDDPVLTLDGTPIAVVEETKYLGVIFYKKFTFIPHIKKLKAKCQKALNLVVAHTDWGADRKVLLNLYRTIVRSKLDYGSIVYGSARESSLKTLDTTHHQGIRLALGAFRTSPADSLLVEANEPSLNDRPEKLSLQFALKLKSNRSNPTYNTVFRPNYFTLFQYKPNAIPTFGIQIAPTLNSAGQIFSIYTQTVQKTDRTLHQPVYLRLTLENAVYLIMHPYSQQKSKPLIWLWITQRMPIYLKFSFFLIHCLSFSQLIIAS